MPEESRRTLPRLDAHAPLVIDTRDLGRRPGTMRRLSRSVPAPADLSVEMIGVPERAGIELDLRLEAVRDGVLVSGTARAPVSGECARCLDPLTSSVQVEIQELFAYPDEAPDDEAPRLAGDLIDLEPTLRDAVVVELPLAPLCRADCPGLCPVCGGRLADLPSGHTHPVIDPRWAALADLNRRTDDDSEN